jgi:hypothetical protein
MFGEQLLDVGRASNEAMTCLSRPVS